MTHTPELINKLRQQYTLNNDGGGLDGKCRVSNKDLLALLLIAESLEQQNAALSEQVAGLVGAVDIWQENPTTGNGFALIDAAAIAKAGSHE